MQDDAIAASFFPSLLEDLARWRAGEDIDFQARHAAAVRDIGPARLMIELFRRLEDSVLSDALYATGFAWQGLAFATWREVLRAISDNRQAVYQFVWFAAQFLGVDVLAMIAGDPAVDAVARDFVGREFPGGAPRAAGSWERDAMDAVDIDAMAMWRRLAAEGAPMKVDLAQLQA